MKKIIWIFAIGLIMGWVCFGWDYKSSEYVQPKYYEKMNFNAFLDWSKVVTKWTPIDKSVSSQDFKYYKVVKSKTNPNPVYPEDWYIHYTDDIKASYYEDNKIENWYSYYRVCAIFTVDRYCSNVVKVIVNNSSEKIETPKKEYYKESPKKEEKKEPLKQPQTYLSEQVKNKLNGIVFNFDNKLKTKLQTNKERVQVIDNVLAKLRAYNWLSATQKLMQNYLITKLENLRSSYDDETSELESLFNF